MDAPSSIRNSIGTMTGIVCSCAVVLAACAASSTPMPGATARSITTPAVHGGGCVGHAEAQQIWTSIDSSIAAIEADPKHAGAERVMAGAALAAVRQYLAQLESNGWTEVEVDRLDTLTVADPGCSEGALKLRVTVTLARDDYITASGQVDHADALTGRTLHFANTYVRAGAVWKESDFQSLDTPAPSPSQLI